MSWTRISALILRYNYLYRRNLGRLFDVLFWPVVELVVWGFVSVYLLSSGADVPVFVSFFLGALMLWEVVYRSNLGVAASFLEDHWTKNFLNLFASPLRPSEFVIALLISSFLRVAVGTVIMITIGLVFYGFNLFTLGVPLVLFFANLLVFGWSLGIVSTAIILRFGQGAEILAWAFVYIFQPFSAVFYPVAVLPAVFQAIAKFVPASHIFEGMRTVITTGQTPWGELGWAAALNIVYALAAALFFASVFKQAKQTGRLTRSWQ